MELSKTFDPQGLDERWYQLWLRYDLFHATPDERPPYTVVIPPPNITGVLHMGHCLNNTVQDILIRRARMLGMNACWVPGTDHASIATEAKVVALLREQGIHKGQLTREEFLGHAWAWKEKYGGIILQQLKKLGCALDWKRTTFTMDEDYSHSVNQVFVRLYNQGWIYRGKRMIHWDPQARTALSDEEVIYREVTGDLYYVSYRVDDSPDTWITVATARPETILGDTAICVHPDDERYQHLIGKHAWVPLVHRRIPIITDTYVDPTFGSGALKVTPAHDANDYQLGLRHQLAIVDVMNDDGTMNAEAGPLAGLDRFDCRKRMVQLLQENGQLVRTERYTHKVGYSERSNAVVEPRLSLQWWVRMSQLAEPALRAVERGDIRFYPSRYVNLYRHWMENIRDWCISRQLWWGHRIPAWYTPDGQTLVALTREQAWQLLTDQQQKPAYTIDELRQDEDVLDTWFSSWLWPIEVFHGISKPGNKDFAYFYPTQALVTAPEIIFFWVARMIMAGYAFAGERPFREVYFTGIVRDQHGRKMSKSLGNSPDLLQLIEKYGADAVRFGVLISSPAGNDLLFSEKLIEQGKHFNNKIWNALRLIKGWTVTDEPIPAQPAACRQRAIAWFERRLHAHLTFLDEAFAQYDLFEALKRTYTLIWEDFCSWYLEMIKPSAAQPMDRQTFERTTRFFETLMQVLHPFMPFITEEIFHQLQPRPEGTFLLTSRWPKAASVDPVAWEEDERLKQIVMALREHRNRHRIGMREELQVYIKQKLDEGTVQVIRQLGHANVHVSTEAPAHATLLVLAGTLEVKVESREEKKDTMQERQRLVEELAYQQGFLESVNKKLSNEKFLAHARPEVLEKERQKALDARERIRILQEQLARWQ